MTSDEGHRRDHAGPVGPAMLHTVVALRWQRPRFAAELASRVLDDAADRGDGETWLGAAGWLLYGRAAVGDAREVALELLTDMEGRAGPDALRASGSARLRVELAALAQANGDPDVARDLLDDWAPAGPDADRDRIELDLDRLAVLVRCALVDGVDDLAELRADVEAIGGRLDGDAAGLAELLLGSVHRDDGEPAAAAERALRGLARLGWSPDEPTSAPRSPHLGCALLCQWVTAHLEDGSASDIPDGVKRLVVTDGGRHGVLWRLAVARAFAGQARPTADVLEDAASAAADVDAPSLEAACRSAQAELFESAGRFQEALGAVRSAMAAERTDRERARRLRDALAGPAASVVGGRAEEAVAPSVERPSVLGVDVLPATEPTAGLGLGAPPDPLTAEPAPAASSTTSGADPLTAEPVLAASTDMPAVAPSDAVLGRSAEATPTSDLDGAPVPQATINGSAGSAMATLDAARRDLLDVSLGGVEPAADDDDGGPVVPTSAPAGLGDGLGVDVDPEADGGSPLADELLDELFAASRAADAPSVAPSTALSAPPEADSGPLVIVLDLVDDAGRPADHGDAAAVVQELAARAGRLVPPGSVVSGSGETGGAHGRSVTVSLPEAGETVALLWARSLVDHVAPRVPRRGLPDGTTLTAGVAGPAGQLVRAVCSRVLTGPADEVGRNGSAPDVPTANGAARDVHGGSRLAAIPLAGLDVRPGSGGRRRRDRAADDAGAHANGTRSNGAVVHRRSRHGSAPDGPSRGTGAAARNGSTGPSAPHGWTIDGLADCEPDAGTNGRGHEATGLMGGADASDRAVDGAGPTGAGDGSTGAGDRAADVGDRAADVGDRAADVGDGSTGAGKGGIGDVAGPAGGVGVRADDGSGAPTVAAAGARDHGDGPAAATDGIAGPARGDVETGRHGRLTREAGGSGPGRRRRTSRSGVDGDTGGAGAVGAAAEVVPADSEPDGRRSRTDEVTDASSAVADPLDPAVPLTEIGVAWVDRSSETVDAAASPDVSWRPLRGAPREDTGRHGDPVGDGQADPSRPGGRRGGGRRRAGDTHPPTVGADPQAHRPAVAGSDSEPGPDTSMNANPPGDPDVTLPGDVLPTPTTVAPADPTTTAPQDPSTVTPHDPSTVGPQGTGTTPGPVTTSATTTEPEETSEPATGPAPETAPTGDGGRPEPVRRARRPRTGRRPGRTPRGPTNGADPTAIPDDLGLGDLLAGALAAYRDI